MEKTPVFLIFYACRNLIKGSRIKIHLESFFAINKDIGVYDKKNM